MKIVYAFVHLLVNLNYVTNITCIGFLINIFSFYVYMCFFKDASMGALSSTMGDPLILNVLIEMLRSK